MLTTSSIGSRGRPHPGAAAGSIGPDFPYDLPTCSASTIEGILVSRKRPIHPALLFALAAGIALGFASMAAAQPDVESFQLVGADNVPIKAYWIAHPGKDAPVALLLHDPGASYRDWGTLVPPLQRAGFQVMLIDFRGHGASRELAPEVAEQLARRSMSAYQAMRHDVQAAIDWLVREKRIAPQRIALVGGQFAATLAVQAMVENPKLGAAVGLSAANTYFGVSVEDLAKKYGKRPLLLIVPKQLLPSGASGIAKTMTGNPDFQLKTLPRTELQGVYMLGTGVGLEAFITDWLAAVFDLDAS
jgi:dienelactone hydrolase